MKLTLTSQVAALFAAGACLTGIASAQNTTATPLYPNAKPRFVTVPRNTGLRFAADQPTPDAAGLPTFTRSFSYGGRTYTYTMVGADPTTGTSTTVPVVLVPLIVTVGGVTFDPTKPVSGSTYNELTLIKQSPVFKPVDLHAGTTDLGANQYIDNFRRANFWSDTGSGTNGYHLLMGTPTVKSPITLNVSASNGQVLSAAGGNLANISYDYFNSATSKILANTKLGINSSEFVLFITYDVVFYQGTQSNCCIIGFHSQDGNLTYGVASYVDSGDFTGLYDVEVLTHEIGEAMDDPTINNIVPSWGGVGQVVGGCQDNLEVGDPVTGTYTTVTMPSGLVYHPEDLVFVNWFTRTSPSPSVNGWYTLLNTFHGDAKKCPPGGTN